MSTGPKTRGGLVPAQIYECDDKGKKRSSSKVGTIYCTFNPEKYTISITNNFSVKGMSDKSSYNIESNSQTANPRELSIQEIWFDAYEDGKDVKKTTDNLMTLAELQDKDWTAPPPPAGSEGTDPSAELKPPPAKVKFEWGSFSFLGIIKALSIDFLLFDKDGKPVRAKVNLKLTEFKLRTTVSSQLPSQNPSSGGGPMERVWVVTQGDRLDYIASEIYGDATKWRHIARHNKVENPFSLKPGTELAIPSA